MGELLRPPAQLLLVVGMLWNTQIVHSNSDVLSGHCAEKAVSTDPSLCFIDHHGIQVVRMTSLWIWIGWSSKREIGERLVILLPDLLASQPVLFDSAQLMDADGGLQIHHVVLETRLDHRIVFVAFIAET